MYDELGFAEWQKCSHSRINILNSSGAFMASYPKYPWLDPSPVLQNEVLGSGYECMGNSLCALPRWDTPTSTDDSLSRAYEQYLDIVWNTGVSNLAVIEFIREFSSTVALVKNPLKAFGYISKYSTASKKLPLKKHYRSAVSNTRKLAIGSPAAAAANTWLQGVYGWFPLISDLRELTSGVSAAMSARRSMRRAPPIPVRISVRGSSEALLSPEPAVWMNYARPTSGRMVTKTTSKIIGTLTVNPDVASESPLVAMARCLQADQLLKAGWDAVPYSFVADWFYPVGDKLARQLRCSFYINTQDPWVCQRSRTVTEVVFDGIRWYPTFVVNGSASYVEEALVFSRYQTDFESGLNTNTATGVHGARVASGLALVYQVSLGRKR
jgi:hypothetical protein